MHTHTQTHRPAASLEAYAKGVEVARCYLLPDNPICKTLEKSYTAANKVCMYVYVYIFMLCVGVCIYVCILYVDVFVFICMYVCM